MQMKFIVLQVHIETDSPNRDEHISEKRDLDWVQKSETEEDMSKSVDDRDNRNIRHVLAKVVATITKQWVNIS